MGKVMCLYPTIIKNPKYKVNKKNGGNVPTMWDDRVQYVPIACGVCAECVAKRARDWRIRMNEELKSNPNGWVYVTLTFSEQALAELTTKYKTSECNGIATKAVRLFLERYRKENKKSAKHWLITELGHNGTERIHLHGVIQATREQIAKHWAKWGFSDCDTRPVTARTINYILKYVTKTDIDHKGYIPIVLCSPGIGKGYLQTEAAKLNKFDYIKRGTATDKYYFQNGKECALPIYYRNHIYSELEREVLWVQKIEQDVRWIDGIKITNASKKEQLCNELRAAAQEKSERNGFPKKEDWERKAYNVTNRKINAKKR